MDEQEKTPVNAVYDVPTDTFVGPDAEPVSVPTIGLEDLSGLSGRDLAAQLDIRAQLNNQTPNNERNFEMGRSATDTLASQSQYLAPKPVQTPIFDAAAAADLTRSANSVNQSENKTALDIWKEFGSDSVSPNPYRSEILDFTTQRNMARLATMALNENISEPQRLDAFKEWNKLNDSSMNSRIENDRTANASVDQYKQFGDFTFDDRMAWDAQQSAPKWKAFTEWTQSSEQEIYNVLQQNSFFAVDGKMPRDQPAPFTNALIGVQMAGESLWNMAVRDFGGGAEMDMATSNSVQAPGVGTGLIRGIAQYTAVAVPAGYAIGATGMPVATSHLLTSIVADIGAFDPKHGNLSTLLVDMGAAESIPALQRLDSKSLYEDGKISQARIAQAVEGLLIGQATAGVIKSIKPTAKAIGVNTKATLQTAGPTLMDGARAIENALGIKDQALSGRLNSATGGQLLTNESKNEIVNLYAFGVARTQHFNDNLLNGMTHEEAVLDTTANYPYSAFANGLHRVQRVMMANEFNLSVQDAGKIIDDVTRRGVNMNRVFYGQPPQALVGGQKVLNQSVKELLKTTNNTSLPLMHITPEEKAILSSDIDAMLARPDTSRALHASMEIASPWDKTWSPSPDQINQLKDSVHRMWSEKLNDWVTQEGFVRPQLDRGVGRSSKTSLKGLGLGASFQIKKGKLFIDTKFDKAELTYDRMQKPLSKAKLKAGQVPDPADTIPMNPFINNKPNPEWTRRAEGVGNLLAARYMFLSNAAANGDEAAKQIMGARDWYREVSKVLGEAYGPAAYQLAELLGATSAQTDVAVNWQSAMDILKSISSGAYETQMTKYVDHLIALEQYEIKLLDTIDKIKSNGATGAEARQFAVEQVGKKPKFDSDDFIRKLTNGKKFGANSEPAMRVLAGIWGQISDGAAPKTINFAKNLVGNYDRATIDVWANRTLEDLYHQFENGIGVHRRIPPGSDPAVSGEWKENKLRGLELGGGAGLGTAMFDHAVKQLKDAHGVDVDAASLQALMWFDEKQTWAVKNKWSPEAGGDFRNLMQVDLSGEAGQINIAMSGGVPSSGMEKALHGAFKDLQQSPTVVVTSGSVKSSGETISARIVMRNNATNVTAKVVKTAKKEAGGLDAFGNPVLISNARQVLDVTQVANLTQVLTRFAQLAKEKGFDNLIFSKRVNKYTDVTGKELYPALELSFTPGNLTPKAKKALEDHLGKNNIEFSASGKIASGSDGQLSASVAINPNLERTATVLYVPDTDPMVIEYAGRAGVTKNKLDAFIQKQAIKFQAKINAIQTNPARFGLDQTEIGSQYKPSQHEVDFYGPDAIETISNANAAEHSWNPRSAAERIYDSTTATRSSTASDLATYLRQRRGVGVQNGSLKQLNSVIDDTVRGRFWGDEQTGIAWVAGMHAPDLNTAMHEMSHVVRNQLLNRNLAEEARFGVTDDSIGRIEREYGVVNGTWTVAQEERFADDLASIMEDQTRVPPGILGEDFKMPLAYLRDAWRGVSQSESAKTMTADVVQAMENLRYRTDLPIEYAPGKYMPPIQFGDVLERMRLAQESGQNWLEAVDPEDVLGKTQMHKFPGRPTAGTFNIRDPATGKWAKLTDKQRALMTPEGEQTVRDNLRFMENDDDVLRFMAYYDNLAKEMERAGMLDKSMTMDAVNQRGLGMLNELLYQHGDDMSQGIQSLWARTNDLRTVDRDLPAFIVSTQLAVQGQLNKVVKLAKKAVDTDNPADYALLQRSFFDLQMLRHQFLKVKSAWGRSGVALNAQTLPNAEELKDFERARRFLLEQKFTDDTGKPLAETLAKLDPNLDPNAALRILNDTWRTRGKRDTSVILEVFRNGLLSLPRTWFSLQAFSAPMVAGIEGTQKLATAVLKGDSLTAIDTLAAIPRMLSEVRLAVKFAGKAFIEEQPQLMKGATIADTGSRAIVSQDPNNIFHNVINYGGRAVRLPSTFIGMVDEFWKQVSAGSALQSSNYRLIMSQRLQAAGIEGINNTTQFILRNDRSVAREAEAMGRSAIMNGHLRDQRVIANEAITNPAIAAEPDPIRRASRQLEYIDNNWTPNQQRMTRDAALGAQRNTFTEAMPGLMGSARKAIQKNWWLQVIVPFYTTPMNILRRAFGYGASPLMFGGDLAINATIGAPVLDAASGQVVSRARKFGLNPDSRLYKMHTQTMEDMMSGEPARQSRAQGQILVSLGILTAGYEMFHADKLTGYGPMDPEANRQWKQSGKIPYALNVGGKWVEYRKLDPFGTMLGWMADYHELTSGMYENKEEDAVGGAAAIMYAISASGVNKSSLLTIDQMLEGLHDPYKWQQVMTRMGLTINPVSGLYSSAVAGSMRLNDPNIYQTGSTGGEWNKEMQIVLNEMRKNSWVGKPFGGRDALVLRYNAIGEPLQRFDPLQDYPWLDEISPITVRSERNDVVTNELLTMGAIWRPALKTKDGIDLSAIRIPETKRTAYDFYNDHISMHKLPYPGGGNVTLRKYLENMFNGVGPVGERYAAIRGANPSDYPGSVPPDIAEVRSVIERYRMVAWQETIKASAELSDKLTENHKMGIETRMRDAQNIQKNMSGKPSTTDLLKGLLK